LNPSYPKHCFAAGLDAKGNFDWATTVYHRADCYGVEVDSSGASFIAGGKLDTSLATNWVPFVARVDDQGSVDTGSIVDHAPPTSFLANKGWCKALARDERGPLCAGNFERLNVDGDDVVSTGEWDAFVSSWDSKSKKTISFHSAGSSSKDGATGVALDGSGRVWVVGFFSGLAAFESTQHRAAGETDFFIWRLERKK
jgi:hypothetical protein